MKNGIELLKCPSCGGKIDFDENQEYGFCKYCGSKVQNKNFKKIKITLDETNKIKKYLSLANIYYENNLYSNALDFYNKVLEIDTNDYNALFRKGLCETNLTTYDDFNVSSMMVGLNLSISSLKNTYENDINTLNQIIIDLVDEVVFNLNISTNFINRIFLSESCHTENSILRFWKKIEMILEARIKLFDIIKDIPDDTPSHDGYNYTKELVQNKINETIKIDCELLLKRREYLKRNIFNSYTRVKCYITKDKEDKYKKIYEESLSKLGLPIKYNFNPIKINYILLFKVIMVISMIIGFMILLKNAG